MPAEEVERSISNRYQVESAELVGEVMEDSEPSE